MIDDALRLVGSAQTNRDMEAELTRIAGRALGMRPPSPSRDGTGQLVYPWDAELARVAHRYHRTSTRVVRDLYQSSARRLEPLYDELRGDAAADRRGWDERVRTISVEVRRVAEFAAGERQIVGTVKNAILDGLASRGRHIKVDSERPDALVVARLDDRGRLRIGLDLTGGTRTRRGWRIEAGDAPLREHVAAVIAMEARYDPRRDLVVDPMCGSGTLAIEAALLARGAPVELEAGPNRGAPAAIDLWPDARPVVIAGDHDLAVLAGARANAGRAGAKVVWHRGDFAALTRERIWALAADAGAVPERGLVLCNPPWGQRLEVADARVLYGALGDWWRSLGNFRAAFLVANPEFEEAFGSTWAMRKPLSSGDLRGYLYVYEPAKPAEATRVVRE